ncbi:MAG: hypothetical protein JXQ81_10665 [Desulfuromonadales bacterium]|nr:hypothetical protein [Desulfuromonadales bacterium]
MKYKLLALIALLFLVIQFVYPSSSFILIPLILTVLLLRNGSSLKLYLTFLLPSFFFILLIYSLLGQWQLGLQTVLLLTGTSLCLQLYLAYFPKVSLYVLLRSCGCPERYAFIVYGAVNYALFIKPLINEIRDAQRLRGVEIPNGIRALFHFHILLVPLMVRLIKGADHLAESLYLRGGRKGEEAGL